MSIQAYTEDQTDALRELVNMAMGKAGDALARSLSIFIELSVPRVRLLAVNEIATTVAGMLGEDNNITAVQQTFTHSLDGEAMLIFTHDADNKMVGLMGHDNIIDEGAKQKLILELSNLLNSSIISGIAEILQLDLNLSPPLIIASQSPLNEVFTPGKLSWSQALLTEVSFTIENHTSRCHFFMLITDKKIESMRSLLNNFMDNF